MSKALFLLLFLSGCTYPLYEGDPPKPFVSDGCSGQVWRSLTGNPGPWEDCCVEHDLAYWKGGSEEQRLKADAELMQCVANHDPYVAIGMFLGVRVGGHPGWPTSWKWGYGR